MYIIIVGAGDIGRSVIDIATQSGNEVVVIENDRERAEWAADTFDCLVLNDDATVMDTLEDAGIDQADAIISTTERDATNIMICLLAKEFEIADIISVVNNPEHLGLFERIGINTMENPERLIAEHLYRAVERPSVVDFMQIGEHAEVFEIIVSEDAPVAGYTLHEADQEGLLTDDILIVAVERPNQDDPITPRGSIRIEPGDLLTVYSAVGAKPEITDLFGHYDDHL